MPQTTATTWAAFKKQYANKASQSGAATPNEVTLQSSVAALQSRTRGSWSPAPASAPAAGNWRVTSDARGAPAAYPGHGTGNAGLADNGPQNESPYGGISGRQVRPWIQTPPSMLNRQAYGGYAYQNGKLIAPDRHIMASQGKTSSSNHQQATGGTPNPEKDGPPQTSHKMLNRVLSWMIGASYTRGLNNNGHHATVPAGNNPFPLGTQGDRTSRVYGGTPGLTNFRAYGSRTGVQGGPQPFVYAAPGGPWRFGTLLAQGSPQDGPQSVNPGVPWGLHSSTVSPAWINSANQKIRLSQVAKPYRNRPLNSRSAGQSMGQSIVHLDGSQAVQIAKLPASPTAGVNSRFLPK